MTDKDPKDMTASELLRWLADDDNQSNCQACSRFYASDECGGKMCSDWKRDIADKIDAEIVKAYSEKLDTCAMRWAKANGWPDFRDSEDFGAWLERCALPRPRFEDGEPVQMGDEIAIGGGSIDVNEAVMLLDGSGYRLLHSTDVSASAIEDRVKRPAPEVLGADGLPLNEDDTVYGTGREQHRYTVQVPYSINEEVGKRFCVQCYDHDEGNITWCDPSMLTHERPVLGADGKPIVVGETVWSIHGIHEGIVKELNVNMAYVEWSDGRWSPSILCDKLTHTPPDTQEKINADKNLMWTIYWDCTKRDCLGCDVLHGKSPSEYYNVHNCSVAQGLDIARRQAELDKRTGGEE